SHGALDLGSTRYMKNEGTVRVLEGTARRYCSKVLLLFESTAHYAQSTARCESTAVMFEGTDEVLEGTAQEYESTAGANLSTAEVYESTAHSLFKLSFTGRLINLNFRDAYVGSDFMMQVRARHCLFGSSSNRGRLLGIIDLMRQKNKRMKQEGLNRQIGKLQDVT
ncbi:hypothetical protein Tco_0795417, partial [Tanacetum coccineum]